MEDASRSFWSLASIQWSPEALLGTKIGNGSVTKAARVYGRTTCQARIPPRPLPPSPLSVFPRVVT